MAESPLERPRTFSMRTARGDFVAVYPSPVARAEVAFEAKYVMVSLTRAEAVEIARALDRIVGEGGDESSSCADCGHVFADDEFMVRRPGGPWRCRVCTDRADEGGG